MPADYAGFIDFIKSHNKNSLNFLLIGLDFFGSSNFRFSRANWLETKDYIKNSNDWYYLFKLFISPNCFKYSIKNLYGSLSRKSADPVHSIIMNMNELEKNEIYFDDIYGHYQYNNNYVRILKDIINANTDARIIIFTTPVAKCHFDLILQYHLYDEYEKWLTDLTNVCEGYYNFMDITPLTNDPKNWADANHLTSEVGIKMIRKLLQNLCQDTDNYTYVTADKVKTYLENIRMKLEL
ncbi:hypothetical protein JXQ31_20235 [candidate division KSB1 bacterium]|nr:hypothetical protein [candidate division KSB1 bacterium]